MTHRDNKTTWEDNTDGSISVKTRNKEYWRTLAWPTQDVETASASMIAVELNAAYDTGYEEALADVRKVLGVADRR